MAGIEDIQILLRDMEPVIDGIDYVFCSTGSSKLTEEIVSMRPVATILEEEGMTVVVSKKQADECKLSYSTIFQKISLNIHSSLEAVGLTAAISTALAIHNISANMVAGYYHDHIYIRKDHADLALEILEGLGH